MESRNKLCGDTGSRSSGLMMGIVLGSVVAGAVAFFFVSQPGKELQSRIKDEVTETQQMFRTWMNDLQQRAESICQIFRREINSAVESSGDGKKPEE